MEVVCLVDFVGCPRLAVLPFVLGEDTAAFTYESEEGWGCVAAVVAGAAEPAGFALLVAVSV